MTVEKVAVVTAGGSGIGAAAARRFSRDGYKVAILSSSGKGEALANELGGFGLTGSNQSPADIKKLIDGAVDRWGSRTITCRRRPARAAPARPAARRARRVCAATRVGSPSESSARLLSPGVYWP